MTAPGTEWWNGPDREKIEREIMETEWAARPVTGNISAAIRAGQVERFEQRLAAERDGAE